MYRGRASVFNLEYTTDFLICDDNAQKIIVKAGKLWSLIKIASVAAEKISYKNLRPDDCLYPVIFYEGSVQKDIFLFCRNKLDNCSASIGLAYFCL